MGLNDIAFPNLGIYLEDVHKNLTIGGFTIAYYGIIIGIGILLGFTLAAWGMKDRGMNPDLVWDFSIYAIVFSILGARIYYVATSWELYRDNPLSVWNLRQGGLAIYGAVIAGLLTMYLYCRRKKLGFLQFADSVIMGLVLGQIIGRWGNFFNREAFGGFSDGLFAMRLPVDALRSADVTADLLAHVVDGANYIQVHPTFLYEAMWNLLLLIFLFCYRRHKRFEGEMLLLYIMCYGIGRFMIESIRTDQLLIPGTEIPISMFVSAVSAFAALLCILIMGKKSPRAQYVVGDMGSDGKQ